MHQVLKGNTKAKIIIYKTFNKTLQEMAAILSDYRKRLEKRRASVKAEYKKLTKDGSSKTEVVKYLASKYQMSTVSIYTYLKA